MKKTTMTLACGALICTVSARTLTCLSGEGWTCDGEPVSVPHTWNATDACDGPGETAKLWTGAKGGN